MSKRYFYTDPLAAAWMAKHFGFSLECDFTQAEMLEHEPVDSGYPFDTAMISDDDVQMWSDVINARCRRIYVHPDSLHLLEPRVGDFVSFYREYKFDGTSKKHGHLTSIHEDAEYPWTYDDGASVYASSSKPQAIIQRDGKPFFMPESEAA